jgi:vitamin B12 transporter
MRKLAFLFFIFFLLSLALPFFPTPTAIADDSALGLIVVTSARTEENLREVTSNITVLDTETIENSPAETLQEILTTQGFNYTKVPGSLGTVTIRGFATDSHGLDLGSHVLILLNGRRLGTGNTSMISLANVDRIEIIRGPAAVQYGTAAMGGVVNVITKKGKDTPFGATLKATAGNFGIRKGMARFIGSRNAFDFSGGYLYSKYGVYKAGGGRIYNNSDYENYAASGEIGYSFTENNRVAFNFNYYDSPDSGNPNAWKASGDQGVNRTDKYNYSFGLDYVGSTSNEKWSWYARVSSGKDYREYIYPLGLSANTWYKVDAVTGQLQLNYKGDFWDIVGGFDHLNYDITQSSNANQTPNSTYGNQAFFALSKFRFIEDSLILSAGVRYDMFKFDYKKTGLVNKKHNVSPSVGIAYLPVDFLKIRAHYSEGFAMPTPQQLTADYTSSSGMHYKGDENLKPETSKSYELGFDLMFRHTWASLSYFYIKSHNFIEYFRVVVGKETEYRNMDVSYRSGLEFSVSTDLGALWGYDFTLKPSLSLTHMFKYRTRNTPADAYVYLTGIAQDIISGGLSFDSERFGLTANIRLNYFSSEYEAGGDVDRPTYMVADLFLKKKIIEFGDKGKLSATLDVNNIADKLYYSYNTSAGLFWMPGRTLSLTLMYEY